MSGEVRFTDLFALKDFVTSRYGATEEDTEVLVTFREGPHGVVIGDYDGKTVYRNPDEDTMSKIRAGQTWLCRIVPDEKDTRKCYAVPVTRTEGPGSIIPYEVTAAPAVPETVEDAAEESGPAEEEITMIPAEDHRIDELMSKIDLLTETVAVMAESVKNIASVNARLEESERRNGELSAKLSDAEYRIECMSSEITHLQSELDLARNPVSQLKTVSPDSILRVEPDTIFSTGFTEDAYDILVSGDGKTMVIRPSANGRIVCKAGSIRMSGLDRISDFEGPAELDCTRNPSTGTYIVKLKAGGSA